MSSILIVYATREGQTEKIAKKMALHLKSLGAIAEIHHAGNPYHFKLDQFDFILCGGSMHAGGIERELIDFIKQHQPEIAAKPNAFFLVLLSAATKDPSLREKSLADANSKLNSQVPAIFQKTEFIAGALQYSKYPWPLKWLMRRIAKQEGEDTDMSRDYEYTDWNQVTAFSENILKMISEQKR